MSSRRRGCGAQGLDILILAAFREARRGGELGAAEHLLCALEALAAGAGDQTSAPASLDKASLSLADDARGSAHALSPSEGRPRRTH